MTRSIHAALGFLALPLVLPLVWMCGGCAHSGTTHDPAQARLVTEDIPRFWAAYDSAIDGSEQDLRDALQRGYLDPGTAGVRGFTPHRIQSAEHLARTVRAQRAAYEARRDESLSVESRAPAIRQSFERLRLLYPDAVFPDVYFVIGAMNSGGTATDAGLLIGMEMSVNRPETIAALVTHEAVHYLQSPPLNRRLLEQSIVEGAADFIGEMASGGNINADALAYARANIGALWPEFSGMMRGGDYGTWLYVHDRARLNGRPPDLGYAIGHLICEALYARSADKAEAIRTIVECRDPEAILRESGFEDRAALR